MNNINWRAVDLNLLVVFDTLMTLRSVSKAADKLSVGQSAMSHSLSRLRGLLDDPLFERQGQVMMPSKKALELAPVITHILNQISEQVLHSSGFEPNEYQGKLKIGLTDYAELLFAPALFDAILQQAPFSQICFYNVDRSSYQQAFLDYQLDFMIGSVAESTSHFTRTHLYTEQHVCLFDPQSTGISLPITMSDYLSVPHALASPNGQLTSGVDSQLAERDKQRTVSITSRNFLTLRHLIRGRKLLCVVPELMAKLDLFSHDLACDNPPVEVPDFDIDMLWEKRNDQHGRSLWLREVASEAILNEVKRLKQS